MIDFSDYILNDYYPNNYIKNKNTKLFSLDDWNEEFVHKINIPFKCNNSLLIIILSFFILNKINKSSVLILNSSRKLDKCICFLNSFLFFKRKILLFDPFPTSKNRIIKIINKRMLSVGATAVVVWSRECAMRICKFLSISSNNFLIVPYKCNYTKNFTSVSAKNIGSGSRFIFSGGNSARDYDTLFRAVDGTNILTIISTTDFSLFKNLIIPDNVVITTIREPYYSKMISACKLYVISIQKDIIRSAGEQNFLNAYYFSKPIVCADDLSAMEYIINGVTGYVVKSGDVDALKEKILELWNNDDLSTEMGKNGNKLLYQKYTHDMFKKRIINIAFNLNS